MFKNFKVIGFSNLINTCEIRTNKGNIVFDKRMESEDNIFIDIVGKLNVISFEDITNSFDDVHKFILRTLLKDFVLEFPKEVNVSYKEV